MNYKDAVVVFANDEHLTEFRRIIKEYAGEIPPTQKGAKYAFIHAFEDLRGITSDEKKGIRLRKESLEEGETAILDIELWHLGKEYRNLGQVARVDRPPKTVLDMAKVK